MNKLLTFLLLISNLSFGQKFLEYKKENFSLKYPKEWIAKENYSGTVIFIGSNLFDKDDKFSDNVNLMIQDLSVLAQEIDLKAYAEITEEQVKTMVTDGKMIISKAIKINNREGYLFIYTGKSNGFDLKFKQIVFIENKKAYLVSYTAEQSQYETFLKEADEILNSFKIE